jgi:glutamyl-tRNA synthetase
MGYLPEAMRNYLLRLGFSHGDDEIISDKQAIEWFNLEHVGKSPARFDFKKLENTNAHYIKEKPDSELLEHIKVNSKKPLKENEIRHLSKLLPEIKIRTHSLIELVTATEFLHDDFNVKANLNEKASKILEDHKNLIPKSIKWLEEIQDFTHLNLYETLKAKAEAEDIKFKLIAGIIRALLTASHASCSIFDILETFGKEASLKRIIPAASLT